MHHEPASDPVTKAMMGAAVDAVAGQSGLTTKQAVLQILVGKMGLGIEWAAANMSRLQDRVGSAVRRQAAGKESAMHSRAVLPQRRSRCCRSQKEGVATKSAVPATMTAAGTMCWPVLLVLLRSTATTSPLLTARNTFVSTPIAGGTHGYWRSFLVRGAASTEHDRGVAGG